jgi:hypothetical protein
MATYTCRICGRVDPPGRYLTHGRCRMCQMYWRRYGVERPAAASQFPATRRPCTNCGQATAVPMRGRCNACYQYWHRHGRERPARLWQR